MDNILLLLAIIVTILVIMAATVGVIAERLPRKKKEIIGYKPLPTPPARFTPPPVHKAPTKTDDLRDGKHIFEQKLSKWPTYIHYVDPAFAISIHTPERYSPELQAMVCSWDNESVSLAELNNMQKSLEFIRMMYERNPECVGKKDLYDLLNRYAEQCGCLSESYHLLVTKNGKMTVGYKDMKTKLQNAHCEIERLQTFEDFTTRISSLPNCNDCSRISCKYKPKCGEDVRFNCPLYLCHDAGTDKSAHDFERLACRYRGAQLPMPINGCEFGLMIKDIKLLRIPDMSARPVPYCRALDELEKPAYTL